MLRYFILLIMFFLTGCSQMHSNQTKFAPSNSYYYNNSDFLNYKKEGNGDISIIFLHGFGSSIENWSGITNYFPDKKYTKYLLDLKGAGFSSKPNNSDYSMLANSNILKGFIRDNKIENYILIGHSFGGGVSLFTAINNTSHEITKPKVIILLDTASFKIKLPFFVESLRKPIINNLILSLISPSFQARYTLERIFYDKKKVTNEIVSKYSFFMNLNNYDRAIIQTAKQIVPHNFDKYIEKYENIDVPVLIIWGKEDPVIPVSHGELLSEKIKNSKLVIIEKCGHNPQEEAPERTQKEILSFLEMNKL